MTNIDIAFCCVENISNPIIGHIYFEKSTNLLKLIDNNDSVISFSGVQEASYVGGKLNIVNEKGENISIDMTGVDPISIIDDELVSEDTTWSSIKLNEMFSKSTVKPSRTPTDIPCIFFDGVLPTTKDQGSINSSCHIKSSMYDINCYAKIKVQGNSSTKYNKKNFTINFYLDSDCTVSFKIDFGWGEQSKYVMKANWIDLTHARNIVSAQLWGDCVKARPDYEENVPELLKTSPNYGAIDGFPIKFYGNNVYWGRYTMNIPKDAWMANMKKTNQEQLILCGEGGDSAIFRAAAVWDETDWSDELHSTVPQPLLDRWNQFIAFVMNSSDTDFKDGIGDYVDFQAWLDYYIFGLVNCNLDGFKKNQLWFSYDGLKFIPSVYDLDSTFGLYWDGSKLLPYDYDRTMYEDLINGKAGNLLYIRLEKNFKDALISNYNRLTAGPLSYSNVLSRFEKFISIVPKYIVEEDYASTTGGGKCTGIPSKTTNNIQQIRSWYKSRLSWVLNYLNAIDDSEQIPEIEYITLTVVAGDAINIMLQEGETLQSSDVTIENNIVSPIMETGVYTVNVVKNGYTVKVITINVQSEESDEPEQISMTVDVNDPIIINLEDGETLTSTNTEIINNVVSPIANAGIYIVNVISNGNIIKVITITVNALPEVEYVNMSVYVNDPIYITLNSGDVMSSNDITIVNNTINPISQTGVYTINVTNGKYLVKVITLTIAERPVETYNIKFVYNINNTTNVVYSNELTLVATVGDNDISAQVNAAVRTENDILGNTTTSFNYTYPVEKGTTNNVTISIYLNGEKIGNTTRSVSGATTLTCNTVIIPQATQQWMNIEFDGVLDEHKPINTGLTLCDATNTNWTLFVNWDMTSAISSYTPRVCHCMHEVSPYLGFTMQSGSNSVNVGLTINKGSGTTNQTKISGLNSKNKIIIRRNGDTIEYSRNGTTWIQTVGVGVHNMPMIIGGASDSTGNIASVNGREMIGTVSVKYWDNSNIDNMSSMFVN